MTLVQTIGIDEVGRGCWAGPLTVAALATPTDYPPWWVELDDSKRLTPRKREWLHARMVEADMPLAVVHVMPGRVDELGLSLAMHEAVRRVLDALRADYELTAVTAVVVDGLQDFGVGLAMPRADQRIKEVSGASIAAKVERDRLMARVAVTHPQYGFERNVGYGTAEHRRALETHGPCMWHRLSVRPVAEVVSCGAGT